MSELARIEMVVLLQSADLFAHCRAAEVLRLAGIAQERRFDAGVRIYEERQPAEALFCVVHGSVRVGDHAGASRSVGPLCTFGATEILSGRLREGSAVAEVDTLLLAFETEDFFDLLAGNIDIVKALFRKLLHRGDHNVPRDTVPAP